MKIIVLGCGVIGVTTAYQLAKRGHNVTIIDRCNKSAAECSYANGGQLSYSHAEPWANPAALAKIPGWLIKKHSPLVFRLKADPKMLIWSLKFLANCHEGKVLQSTKNMLRLSMYSKQCLKIIEDETSIAYSQKKLGIIHTFKNLKSFESNIQHAQFQKTLGCNFEILENRKACEDKEPALKQSMANIVGGIYFPGDETGDVNEFTANLAKKAENLGVKFQYDTNIEGLDTDGNKINSVITDKGVFKSDAYVISLGSFSPIILKKIGIKIPIYPMKGYSISIKVDNQQAAPVMGVTDQSNKIVYSRLGNILRVAGTAEFAGYDDSIKKRRIDTLKAMTKELFANSGDIDNASQWACLRPSTPDGLPIIGNCPYQNLFLNTGQGTLGWTLSFASAQVVSDIIEKKQPEIDMQGLTIERFT